MRRPRLDQEIGRSRTGAGSPPARVLVAHGQALTRLGIRRALEERGFAPCGEAGEAPQAVELVAQLSPDVCLVDLDLPGASGAIAAIAATAPGTTLLMLTSSCDDSGLLDGLCAGASGYVAKDAAPERLACAIESALQGEVSISLSLLAALAAGARESRQTSRRLRDTAIPLTSREREVLGLLQRGLRTADIARQLFIEQVTVRSHVCSILKKLSVPNRQAAISLLDETDGSTAER